MLREPEGRPSLGERLNFVGLSFGAGMSVTVGLLDFYILEAGEYVDQLDALVGAAVQAPPESTPFITAARALRGSSTMAKLIRLAELAGSVERVGRAMRDGSVRWTPDVRSAVVSAIDDMRVLLRTCLLYTSDA